MDRKGDRKTLTAIMAAIIFVATMTSLLAMSAISSTLVYQQVYAYGRSQSSGQVNDCGNGSLASNILCQNCDSQIQGNENALSMLCEQVAPEPETETAQIEVTKIISCDFVDTPIELCPTLGQFTINVAGNNPSPSSFPGTFTTIVTLGPGAYQVTEVAPPTPPALTFNDGNFSPDCMGNINAGEFKTCTITNVYTDESAPPPDIP